MNYSYIYICIYMYLHNNMISFINYMVVPYIFQTNRENGMHREHPTITMHHTSQRQCDAGPLLTKRTDVLPQDLMKSRRREIRVETCPIALLFDRQLGCSVAEMPVKSRAIRSLWHPIPRFRDSTRFVGKASYPLVNKGPGWYDDK